MKAIITTKTTKTVLCPHCNSNDASIDHLIGSKTYTSWFCESCGGRYSLQFNKEGGCDVGIIKEWRIDLIVVLKYKRAYVCVKGISFAKESRSNRSKSEHEDLKYFYEESTCPTNWMGVDCLFDSENNDSDPHGMFSFVGHEIYPEGCDESSFDWSKLIQRVHNKNVINKDKF